MIINRTGSWNQLSLEILAVSCPLFLDSFHQSRNRRLAITLEDHSRVTQLLQKTAYGTGLLWNLQTKTVRGVAVTQYKRGSCALSSAVSQAE